MKLAHVFLFNRLWIYWVLIDPSFAIRLVLTQWRATGHNTMIAYVLCMYLWLSMDIAVVCVYDVLKFARCFGLKKMMYAKFVTLNMVVCFVNSLRNFEWKEESKRSKCNSFPFNSCRKLLIALHSLVICILEKMHRLDRHTIDFLMICHYSFHVLFLLFFMWPQ